MNEFLTWARANLQYPARPHLENRFEFVGTKVRADVESSEFWISTGTQLREWADEYVARTGYPLFVTDDVPLLLLKPFSSVLEKCFRKNVIDNAQWPQEPEQGWVTPANWFERLGDTTRTTLVVKYLDGVEFLSERLVSHAEGHGLRAQTDFEARDEGYYASHVSIYFPTTVAGDDWETVDVVLPVEIQVTTQLQELIRRLTHVYYEERRAQSERPPEKWQWRFRSPEFVPNYLGHVLHFLEGMIMEVRERGTEDD